MSLDVSKERLGTNATYIWIFGGALLFLYDGGLSNLFTIKAAAFLFIGMFVAAIVAGGTSYWVLKKIATKLSEKYVSPNEEPGKAQSVRVGYIFYVIHFSICALFVLWCYASFYWE